MGSNLKFGHIIGCPIKFQTKVRFLSSVRFERWIRVPIDH